MFNKQITNKNSKNVGKINKPLRWLLVLNIIGLILLGSRRLYEIRKEQVKQSEVMMKVANGIAKDGVMSKNDATKMLELSAQFERHDGISDADLDWLLTMPQQNGLSPKVAAERRSHMNNILSEATDQVSPSQKEKLYEALRTQIAQADPSEEGGSDISRASYLILKLKETRAIPLLQQYRNDARPLVSRSVKKVLNTLEGVSKK